MENIKEEYFKSGITQTRSPGKERLIIIISSYHIEVKGETIIDAAWGYSEAGFAVKPIEN